MDDLYPPISCEFMKSGEESLICELVTRVFNEFNASLYSEEGVRSFYSYANPYVLAMRTKTDYFVFAAKHNDHVVGMIEVKNCEHISLFFVDKDFQNKGVGRKLVNSALAQCRSRKPDGAVVTVNASPYAVNIYKKYGFTVAGPDRTENGIFFTPMLLDFKASAFAY